MNLDPYRTRLLVNTFKVSSLTPLWKDLLSLAKLPCLLWLVRKCRSKVRNGRRTHPAHSATQSLTAVGTGSLLRITALRQGPCPCWIMIPPWMWLVVVVVLLHYCCCMYTSHFWKEISSKIPGKCTNQESCREKLLFYSTTAAVCTLFIFGKKLVPKFRENAQTKRVVGKSCCSIPLLYIAVDKYSHKCTLSGVREKQPTTMHSSAPPPCILAIPLDTRSQDKWRAALKILAANIKDEEGRSRWWKVRATLK